MRSDFLVHWTGKDICTQRDALTNPLRNAYVERLTSILTSGFWMTLPQERLEGFNASRIQYEVPMTCFTEIRLSQAANHASRYGLLGVGVDRRFVLNRYGAPVHYVRNHAVECIVGNTQEVEGSLRGHDPSHTYFAITVAFMKAMSNPHTDDFHFLDEHEWRIVHTEPQVKAKHIVATGLVRPQFLVPISPADLRLVVLPDDATRTVACSDARIMSWLSGPGSRPILVTVAECQHF